jgi:hypothetical protein
MKVSEKNPIAFHQCKPLWIPVGNEHTMAVSQYIENMIGYVARVYNSMVGEEANMMVAEIFS